MGFFFSLINTVVAVTVLIVFVYTLLGYFLSPFHPVRRTIGKVIDPLLAPIRRIIPPINGLDLSPLVLILILYVLRALIFAVLRSFT